MRVFISADIEGITTTTLWEECNRTQAVCLLYTSDAADEL